MSKAFVTILLIMFSLSLGETVKIKSFDELMDAFKEGRTIKAVVNYGECKMVSHNEEKKAPNAIGGMTVDAWEFFDVMSIGNKNAFVVFSTSKLINYGGYIYNYAKFKITDENKVIITAQYANSKTFEIEMDEKFFTDVNDGDNEGACSFFYDN